MSPRAKDNLSSFAWGQTFFIMQVNQIYDSDFIFLGYMTHISLIDKLSNIELIKQKLVEVGVL